MTDMQGKYFECNALRKFKEKKIVSKNFWKRENHIRKWIELSENILSEKFNLILEILSNENIRLYCDSYKHINVRINFE